MAKHSSVVGAWAKWLYDVILISEIMGETKDKKKLHEAFLEYKMTFRDIQINSLGQGDVIIILKI